MSAKKALTRDQLRGRLKCEPVEHPDGGVVYAQEMTGADFRAYQKVIDLSVKANGDGKLTPDMLESGDTDVAEALAAVSVLTMVDEAGAKLYGDDETDALLAENGLRFVIRFAEASLRLSGLKDDGEPEDSPQDDPTSTSS